MPSIIAPATRGAVPPAATAGTTAADMVDLGALLSERESSARSAHSSPRPPSGQ